MSTRSSSTKKYARLTVIFTLLQILVLLGPITFYLISGFISAEVTSKLVLGSTFIIAALIGLISICTKLHLRSPLWIMVLGINTVINSIIPLVLMVAIGTILDEFLLSPLKNRYKEKRNINREIDKRL